MLAVEELMKDEWMVNAVRLLPCFFGDSPAA
jgi:hypothetical protein